MDLQAIRLMQPNYENPMVGCGSVLRESLVSGNKSPFFRDRALPQICVGSAFLVGAPNVFYIVPELSQTVYRHARDILVNEDSHSSGLRDVDRCDLLFGQRGGII
jgi:hypothetical protein